MNTLQEWAAFLAGRELAPGELKAVAADHGLNYDSLRGAVSRTRARARLEDRADQDVDIYQTAPQPTWEALTQSLAVAVMDPAAPPAPADRALWDLFPAPLAPDMEDPLTLNLERWAYASDFHAPHYNRTMTYRLAKVLDYHQVGTLVVGGDFFDFATPSKHPKTVPAVDLERGLAEAGKLLRALASLVDHLYILPGNHCLRVASKLDEPVSFSRVLGMALTDDWPKDGAGRSKITATSLDYIYIGPEGPQGWVVGHPRWFSTVPAKGVSEVATLKHRNVIGAHNHVVGLARSKDGRYVAIDPGHMTDPYLHAYHRQSDGLSRYPAWAGGFVTVDHSIPTLYSDGLTYWPDYGCKN